MKLQAFTLSLVLVAIQECLSGFQAETDYNQMCHINVGGVLYVASRATLQKFPTGIFDITQSRSRMPPLPTQTYYLDRDGHMFRHILNFLRNNELVLPIDFTEHYLLYKEAEFFGIKELSAALEIQAENQIGPQKAHACVVVVVDKNLKVLRINPSENFEEKLPDQGTTIIHFPSLAKSLLDMGFISVSSMKSDIVVLNSSPDTHSVFTFIR